MSEVKAYKEFSLAGKNLKLNTKEDIQPFIDELDLIPDVEKITLSGNTFGVEAFKAFSESLKTKKHIKVLILSDVFTGRLLNEIPLALTALCEAMLDKEELIELDLSDNAFGPNGGLPLVEFLTHNKALETLKLNNNGLGVGGGTLIANALIEAKKFKDEQNKPTTLKTFIAGRNRLEDGSSKLLSQAFKAHNTLIEIRIPQNGIRPDGIEVIVKGVAHCKDLEILDLQDNTLTDKGGLAVADGLLSWPKLRVLNLADCLIKPTGALAIAKVLQGANLLELKELLLSYNEFDNFAAKSLATAIPNLKNLIKLDLNGNKFKEDSPAADSLRAATDELEADDVLGSFSDMEVSSDEEEEDEDEEVDELEASLKKLNVN